MHFILPLVKVYSLLIALVFSAASIVHSRDATSAGRICNRDQLHMRHSHFNVKNVWHRETSTAFFAASDVPHLRSSLLPQRSFHDRRAERKNTLNISGDDYVAATEFAYTSFLEAKELMQQQLSGKANSDFVKTDPISIIGYVSKKRKLGRSLAFIDMVPGKQPRSRESARDFLKTTISTLWKRQDFLDCTGHSNRSSNGEKPRGKEKFDVCLTTVNPGTKVLIRGLPRRSRNSGEVVLLVQSCQLLGMPGTDWRYVKSILEWTYWGYGHNEHGTVNENKGLLNVDEVAKAACMDPITLRNLVSVSFANSTSNAEAMEVVAREIVERIPFDMNAPDLRELNMQQNNSNDGCAPALPDAPLEISKLPGGLTDTGVDWTSSTKMTVNDIIATHLCNDTTTMQLSTPISFSGWVQARRRFSESISVLKIVDNFQAVERQDASNTNFGNVVTCVLHPELIPDKKNEEDERSDKAIEKRGTLWAKEQNSVLSSVNMYARGAKVQIQGYVTADETSLNPTCWVTNIRLLRSSWAPSIINYILEMLSSGKLDFKEAATALSLRRGIIEAQELASLKSDRQRYWCAVEISSMLQDEQSQRGSINPEDRRLLQELGRLRTKFPLTKIASVPPLKNSGDNLDLQVDVPFYTWQNRRGSSTRKLMQSSRFQTKKEPQLHYMVSEITRITRSHPDYLKRPLQILDIGGGKGHLANALASYLNSDDVFVSVVDIDENTIENGRRRSIASGLEVSYWIGDASTLNDVRNVDDVEDLSFKNADIVVALHACGVLTDVALGHATCMNASFVICPCCFCSYPYLFVSALKQNEKSDKSERMQAPEWLDIHSSDLNQLRKLCEIQGDRSLALEAIHSLCALRLNAVSKRHISSLSSTPLVNLNLSLKMFPEKFSSRNICMVGELSHARDPDPI
mmetsp:Transcript_6403/g.13042  ORF Transcript_6403/g.13042 Transcript_6403/m.13042 type:complete len:915 (+) Transcript_6403:246-2990(+)